MVRVRLTSGEKAGEVIEADTELVSAWVTSGYAELVGPDKPATPERAARRGVETRAKG